MIEREFNFRIWYGKDKSMYYAPYLEAWGAHHDNGHADDISLQYIGIKDINDKEIYEGDIVKLRYENLSEPEIYLGNIIYCPTLMSYMLDSGSKSICLSEFDLTGIEVIGNIYENPELLGDNNE